VLVVVTGGGAERTAAAWPTLPFIWVEFERGGDGVFVLRAEDLMQGERTTAGGAA
jgi:ribosomal protein L3 glutamine methyltransferase